MNIKRTLAIFSLLLLFTITGVFAHSDHNYNICPSYSYRDHNCIINNFRTPQVNYIQASLDDNSYFNSYFIYQPSKNHAQMNYRMYNQYNSRYYNMRDYAEYDPQSYDWHLAKYR